MLCPDCCAVLQAAAPQSLVRPLRLLLKEAGLNGTNLPCPEGRVAFLMFPYQRGDSQGNRQIMAAKAAAKAIAKQQPGWFQQLLSGADRPESAFCLVRTGRKEAVGVDPAAPLDAPLATLLQQAQALLPPDGPISRIITDTAAAAAAPAAAAEEAADSSLRAGSSEDITVKSGSDSSSSSDEGEEDNSSGSSSDAPGLSACASILTATASSSSSSDPELLSILAEQRQRVGAALLTLLQYVLDRNPECLTQQQQQESGPMADVLPAVEQLLAGDGYDFLAWQYKPQVGVHGTFHGACTLSWHLHHDS